jgi:Tfp pilus assembly protein PilV
MKPNGYTLIEALVSFLLLVVAITPAILLATSSVNVASAIQNNIIAANLAQEGVEVIRAIRDTNWLNDDPFDTDIYAGPGADQYEVQWDSLMPSVYSAPGRFITLTGEGLYSYDLAGTQTIFKRKVTITKPSAVELQVISEVTWRDRRGSKNVAVEEHLFDWK